MKRHSPGTMPQFRPSPPPESFGDKNSSNTKQGLSKANSNSQLVSSVSSRPTMGSEITGTLQAAASASCPCLHRSQPSLEAQALRPLDEFLGIYFHVVLLQQVLLDVQTQGDKVKLNYATMQPLKCATDRHSLEKDTLSSVKQNISKSYEQNKGIYSVKHLFVYVYLHRKSIKVYNSSFLQMLNIDVFYCFIYLLV